MAKRKKTAAPPYIQPASPIELRLTQAIVGLAESRRLYIPASDDGDFFGIDEEDGGIRVEVSTGDRVLSYKADILLSSWARLIIECDGHDFHDRTKQQAAYDRSRDRELLLARYTTIRFTGSEIFHDADRCAGQAIDIFLMLDAVQALAAHSDAGHREQIERAYGLWREPVPSTAKAGL